MATNSTCCFSSVVYYGVLVITISTALISILFNLLLFLVLPKYSSLSKNTHVLMASLAVLMGSFSVFEVVRNSFLWYEFSSDEVQAAQDTYSSLCLTVRTYETINALFQSILIIAIAIERVYATIYYNTYDEDKKGFSIVVMAVLIVVHVGLAVNFYSNTPATCFATGINSHAQANTIGIMIANASVPILIALEPVIIASFAWIRWKSRFLLENFFFKQAQITLTQRIHLDHILKGSRILLYVSVSHSVIYVIGLTMYEIALGLCNSTFMQCFHAPIELLLVVGMGNYNGIAMPLIFYFYDTRMRRAVDRWFGIKGSNKIDPGTENCESDERLAKLEDQWNKAFVLRNK